jgi:hypothetical protein
VKKDTLLEEIDKDILRCIDAFRDAEIELIRTRAEYEEACSRLKCVENVQAVLKWQNPSLLKGKEA